MASLSHIFLYVLTQSKVYHWQTKIYNKHVASGGFYDALQPLVDQFIETYQGKYGRIMYTPVDITIENISDAQFIEILNQFKEFLLTDIPKIVNKKDADLITLRDEMLAQTNQTIFLLSLQ